MIPQAKPGPSKVVPLGPSTVHPSTVPIVHPSTVPAVQSSTVEPSTVPLVQLEPPTDDSSEIQDVAQILASLSGLK